MKNESYILNDGCDSETRTVALQHFNDTILYEKHKGYRSVTELVSALGEKRWTEVGKSIPICLDG